MIIELRPATMDDCLLLFQWANDSEVRKNSFHSEEIKLAEHEAWFNNKLNSEYSKILIACDQEKLIGQLRLDIEENIGYISYSVDQLYRGHGYGTLMLRQVIEYLRNGNWPVGTLVGLVKPENTGSCRAFAKAGFFEEREEDHLKFVYKIT